MRSVYVWLTAIVLGLAIALAGGNTQATAEPEKAPDNSTGDYELEAREEIARLESRLAELKPRISDPQEGDNPVLLVEEYLHTALQAVYLAKSLANTLGGTLIADTQDLTALVEADILSQWPQNPLDDWSAMEVLVPADGFTAGAFCLDYCPLKYYSNLGNGPEAISFQLYVYGITPSQGSFKEVAVLGWNKKWAQVPAEVIYGMSFSASPADEPQYRFNPETGEVYEVE